MDAFGSISQFPVRHYLAATAIQSKGLDQLVNDPGAALRRLGELAVNERVRAAERAGTTPAISVAADRSIAARLMRQSLDELRGEAGTKTRTETGAADDRAASRNVAGGESGAASPARQAQARADGGVNGGGDNNNAPGQLSPEEREVVDELRARDREVRAHEQAHKNVGGRYAGAISYDYQKGPDGQQYAVGGAVPIVVSPEATPEATIAKMRVVIAAALAPAEPSPQDRAVAATAQSQLVQASADARAEDRAEMAARAEGDDADAQIGADANNNTPSVENFLAVEDRDSPYNVFGLIDRAA